MEFTKEQIIGMSEALRFFELLSEKDQEKIPKDFVEKIKKNANPELGYPINSRYSLDSKEISDEGIKLISYMYLFVSEGINNN